MTAPVPVARASTPSAQTNERSNRKPSAPPNLAGRRSVASTLDAECAFSSLSHRACRRRRHRRGRQEHIKVRLAHHFPLDQEPAA